LQDGQVVTVCICPRKVLVTFSYLAAAAAGGAILYTAFIFSAAAMAGIANNVFFYFNIFLYAFGNFFVIELKFYAKVAATRAAGLAGGASSAAAEKLPKCRRRKYLQTG